jgi:hypothetical protein
MALGTDPHSTGNTPMKPSAATPGAAPHSTEPRDASKPWLDEDDDKVDWVLLMRCYPNAKSKADLRTAAMAAGAEAGTAAEAARASKDVPMSEQAQGEGVPPGAAPGVAPQAHAQAQPHR